MLSTLLTCPIDGTPLSSIDKQLQCSQGHHFDISRQGYINLLPVQHKKSKNPGDTKAMLAVRQAFLNTGFYHQIANQLNQLAIEYLPESHSFSTLDAGCGEGYYFDHFFNSLPQQPISSQPNEYIGLDISKFAIDAASRRNKAITWVVGSNKNPPVKAESIDLIFCTFGFYHFAGFKKILKPGGIVILTEAAPNHLIQLRKIIYPEVKQSTLPDISQATEMGYQLLTTQSLSYDIDLNNHQLMNLLQMMPHFYKSKQAGKATAKKTELLRCSVDVNFRVLKLM